MADDFGGQHSVQQMIDAGAPQDQVNQWQQKQETSMLQSGAPAADVYKYWHGAPPDTSRLDRQTAGNVAATAANADPAQHVATNPLDALEAGWQNSFGGLITRNALPTTVMPQNAGFALKAATMLGQTVGDLPMTMAGMVAGAAGGTVAGAAVPVAGETGASEAVGGVVGGGAGSFAAPEAFRETYVDYLQHRGGNYFQDFWSRFGQIALNTGKQATIGAVTAPVGGYVGGKVLGFTGSEIAATTSRLTTEAATITTAGAAMQGKMPDKDDFTIGLISMLGFEAAGHWTGLGAAKRFVPNQATIDGANNAMTIFAKTGLTPGQLIAMAQKDPAFKSELMAPTNAAGEVTAKAYFGNKAPERPPFKTNPSKIQQEHDDDMVRLQTDGMRGADEATKRLPGSTLDLFRKLEGSGDDAISVAQGNGHGGAVGRYQIMPDTARQYGFDPSKLKDPEYNTMVASHVLADLQKQFKGNLTDMAVAYNAGPGRARSWINGGRVFSDLPLETQRYLEHAERLGAIGGDFGTQRVSDTLSTQGMSEGDFAPPGKTPLENMQETSASLNISPDWTLFGKNKDQMATTIASNGDIYPAPRSIATYLQKFGQMAGFKFQTGPQETISPQDYDYARAEAKKGNMGPVQEMWDAEQLGAQYQHQTGTDKATGQRVVMGHVYVPDNPDEINRRWYGLGSAEILMHEAGHAIDFNVINGQTRDYSKRAGTNFIPAGDFKDEIIAASKAFRPKLWARDPEYNMKPEELMADAIAQWISNPTMRAKMPLFGAKYAKMLEPYVSAANMSLPRLRTPGDAENDAQWEMPPNDDNWEGWEPPPEDEPKAQAGGGSGGKAGGAGKPPPPPPGRGPGYGFNNPPFKRNRQITNGTIHLNADQLADKIMDIVAPEVKQGGLPEWLNPRKWIAMFQAQLTPARTVDTKLGLTGHQLGIEDMLRQTYASASRAGYFVHYGTLDPTLKDNEIVETSDNSMMKAYAAVKEDGGDNKNFMAYRLAKRTIEKAKQGIDTGVDLDQAKAFIAKRAKEDGTDRYARGAEIMKATKDASIDYATNSGLFSPRMADAVKALNQEHIVMRRQMDPAYNPQPGKGFAVRQPLKKMEGSDRQIVDPVTAEVDNLHTIIAMADRNRALGNIIGIIESKSAAAEKAGLPAVIDMQKVSEEPTKVLKGTLFDEEGHEIPPETAQAAEPFLAARRAQGRMGPNDFMFFRAGVPEIWRVSDPDLAEVLRMSWPSKINPIAQLATKFAGLARAGITGDLAYPFRALFHGQIASAAFAKEGAAPYHDIVRGAMDVYGRGEEYKSWVRNGGASSALSDIDVNYVKDDVNAIFDKTATTFSVLNAIKHPIHMMQILQHNVDAASRVGYTSRLVKKGYSPMKAATMSRTAMLDNHEGFTASWLTTWSKMVPFMPIGFKDIEQVGAGIAPNRFVGTMMKAATWITLPTLINYAANYMMDKNNKRDAHGMLYSDYPKWERDLYWITPPIDGYRLKLKKPYVGGFLFGTMPERFMDDLVKSDPRAFEGWADSMLAQYVPPFIPAVATPMAEQWANKSFFTGRPLIKASLEKNSGWMQYDPDTSETAKAISRLIGPPGMDAANVSPIVIQNYAREWLGTLPMEILKTLEMPYKPPGRPSELADLPFVGSFIARNPGMGAQSIEDFYDAADKMETAHMDFDLAKKRMNPGEIKQTAVPDAFENIRQLRDSIRTQSAIVQAINDNKDMTREEKLKYTDSIYSGLIRTAKVGLQAIDSMPHGKQTAQPQQEEPLNGVSQQ